ncbi:TlpA disulfide reductase family protein [Dongia sp.]|uniref:TlpA disulfide reductase family protein n=1 Tax=Dongia sp. TaxID=1977262 RepID=UPI0034A2C359
MLKYPQGWLVSIAAFMFSLLLPATLYAQETQLAVPDGVELLGLPINIYDAVAQTKIRDDLQVVLATNKLAVVNVWATWCAPCVQELPTLAQLSALGPLDGAIAVVLISQDAGGNEVVSSFLRAKKIDLAAAISLFDTRGDVFNALAIRGLPTSFIVDRNGVINARVEGAIDWHSPEMVAFLRQLAMIAK